MTTAVYAGSFDPVTLGHLDLIRRAALRFDRLIVGIGRNSQKKSVFTMDERIELIRKSLPPSEPPICEVLNFSGLLVDFCKQNRATVIVRGLRAVTDFEAELGIAHANASMASEIDTFFLPTKPQFSFVSSSTVREIASHDSEAGWASLSKYVSPVVIEALRAIKAGR